MIYDCFLYYDEDMLLEIRLNTLADVVDRFVIVESTHTFTGKKRPLHFDINKYSQFKDKIIYVVHDKEPITKAAEESHQAREVIPGLPVGMEVDAWANEAAQRNAIMQGLTQASDDDLILVSDVDEIFSPQVVASINPKKLCTTIYQNFYNYQFNLQVFNTDNTPRKCKLPRATQYKNLVSFFGGEPESFRNLKRTRSVKNWSWLKWNWFKINNSIIDNGGWHFSWVMTPERISEKMSTISHTEYDLPEFNNPEHIMKVIKNAEDIWGRDRTLTRQELTVENFPEYIVRHKDKFSTFII
ncbi:TPA: benzoate transporter [Enterobacter asburiae]|nr:benzoate transporter [Enterobacter asburiae]HDR2772962.1 benzoate transporter [Enterobacter asburiae]